MNDSTASRAMLCLPTGAGKTRVTLQTLVQWLYSVPENENEDEAPTEDAVAHPMSRGALRARPGATVLWCADRKELCEQAALTMIDAWRAFGPKGAELHVHRLFDGRSTPQLRSGESVFVVATVQSLNRRANDRAAAQLLEAADCVVIDEGHKSAASTYRTLIDASVQARVQRGLPSPAVLGLSATPFRSDDTESRALARLFGERLIPSRDEQVPLRTKLREDGTLAEPGWEEINAPAKRALTEEELNDLAKTQHAWLPESVITWLAGQVDNDEPVVDKIKELLDRDEAPVLVFTGNVNQARRLARTIALDLGVTAGTVDGESKFHVQQHAYEALRSGELDVLCNCALLTTGFDAPKVRSVVIARPVLSRVLFQQMVGRGLRGPKNGGTETCTIVTARYDIPELKRELLFREEQLDSWR
jgi:superfamily II DNA or RNA helicase